MHRWIALTLTLTLGVPITPAQALRPTTAGEAGGLEDLQRTLQPAVPSAGLEEDAQVLYQGLQEYLQATPTHRRTLAPRLREVTGHFTRRPTLAADLDTFFRMVAFASQKRPRPLENPAGGSLKRLEAFFRAHDLFFHFALVPDLPIPFVVHCGQPETAIEVNRHGLRRILFVRITYTWGGSTDDVPVDVLGFSAPEGERDVYVFLGVPGSARVKEAMGTAIEEAQHRFDAYTWKRRRITFSSENDRERTAEYTACLATLEKLRGQALRREVGDILTEVSGLRHPVAGPMYRALSPNHQAALEMVYRKVLRDLLPEATRVAVEAGAFRDTAGATLSGQRLSRISLRALVARAVFYTAELGYSPNYPDITQLPVVRWPGPMARHAGLEEGGQSLFDPASEAFRLLVAGLLAERNLGVNHSVIRQLVLSPGPLADHLHRGLLPRLAVGLGFRATLAGAQEYTLAQLALDVQQSVAALGTAERAALAAAVNQVAWAAVVDQRLELLTGAQRVGAALPTTTSGPETLLARTAGIRPAEPPGTFVTDDGLLTLEAVGAGIRIAWALLFGGAQLLEDRIVPAGEPQLTGAPEYSTRRLWIPGDAQRSFIARSDRRQLDTLFVRELAYDAATRVLTVGLDPRAELNPQPLEFRAGDQMVVLRLEVAPAASRLAVGLEEIEYYGSVEEAAEDYPDVKAMVEAAATTLGRRPEAVVVMPEDALKRWFAAPEVYEEERTVALRREAHAAFGADVLFLNYRAGDSLPRHAILLTGSDERPTELRRRHDVTVLNVTRVHSLLDALRQLLTERLPPDQPIGERLDLQRRDGTVFLFA